MSNYPGAFIVIEGSDGSGKKTQFNLLKERLETAGYQVETFDFPRYDQPSSHFVRRYLNGDYGKAASISPYSASLFYALDRFEAAPAVRKALEQGKVVLSNRYVGSNMAHQGAKFTSDAEQRGFFIWADSLEYQLLNIPRPDINLFLRLPAEVSQQLIMDRAVQEGRSLDEHEADINHLRQAVAAYDTLCLLFPKDFKAVDCADDSKLKDRQAINNSLWEDIQPLLPVKTKEEEPEAAPQLSAANPSEDKPNPAESPIKLSLLAVTELARNPEVKPELKKIAFSGRPEDYYIPKLSDDNRKTYEEFMRKIASYRQQIQETLTSKKESNAGEITGLLLPMAAYATVNIADNQLKAAASGGNLSELRRLAKLNPPPAKNSAAKWEKLARDGLPGNLSTDMEPVTLLEAWPRNEFELLSDSLYGLSDLPRQQVQAGIDNWTYDQKYQALQDILGEMNQASLSQVRYRLDVVAEQGLIVELAFSGLLQSLKTQAPTPRYGYEVPEAIEKAGLEGEYIECFDLSLELFSRLQSSDDSASAGYVTLGGHKVRFQIDCNLAALVKPPEYSSALFKAFRRQLLDSISQNHPMIGEWLQKQLTAPAKETAAAAKASKRRRRRPKKP